MRTDYVSFNDVQQGTVPADPLLSMPALPVTSLKEEVTESALHSQVHQLLPGAHYRCQMRNFNADLGAKLRGISGRIYSHRSVSKAFFRHAKGLSPEEKQAFIQAKLGTMEQEIKWLYDTYTELVGCGKTVASSLDDLNAKWAQWRAESSVQHLLSVAEVLAELHCADIVKGTKLSIQADINAFQDLAVALQQWELSEYTEELSGFYRSSFAGVKSLQQRLERYQKMDEMLYSVLSTLMDVYEARGPRGGALGKLLPHRHAILKSLPVLLYLLHAQNGKSLERKAVARAVAVLKKNPVLPLVGDAWMSSLGLLSTIEEFETKFRIRAFLLPHELGPKHLQGTELCVDVCAYADSVRPLYDKALFELCRCVSQAQKVGLDANVIPDGLAQSTLQAYRSVLHLAHSCQWHLQTFYTWRVSSSSSSNPSVAAQGDDSLSNRIVGLFSADEKLAILSLVQVLKDLNQYVQTREYLLFPILGAGVQRTLDSFQAETVEKILLSKKCPESFALLNHVLASHLARQGGEGRGLQLGSGPSLSQLVLLSEIGGEMCYEIDNRLRKTKIFKKEISDKEVLRQLQAFAADAALLVHLLDRGFSLSSTADTSYLWLHEQLFDKMQANKSAVSTSLPWKLFEAQIESARQDLDLEMSLVPMHVYNKVASVNFGVMQKQYIYDELEMEADLALERMAFKIATKVYDIVKMTVSGQHLSKFVEAGVLENEDLLPRQSVVGIVSPKVHNLLGRNVNLRKLVAQRVNKLFRENLDYLMERFEALDISQGILEFHTGYHILESAHQALSEILSIDSWDAMVKEMNENTCTISFGSRLCVYIYKELSTVVPLYYNYYLSAAKFIEDKTVSRRDLRKNPLPVLPSPSFLFGHRIYNETIREISRMHSGTFSTMHFQCLSQLLTEEEIFLVVQKLIEKSYKIVSNAILPSITEIVDLVDESSCFGEVEPVDETVKKFDAVLRVFAAQQGESDYRIFEDLKILGNVMLSILHLSNIENTAKGPAAMLAESLSHGLSLVKSGKAKGLNVDETTYRRLEADLKVAEDGKQGCTSLFTYSVQSLKKLFEEEASEIGSPRKVTAVFNAIHASFCQDNKDQVQNIQKFGDTVPFAFVLLSHVFGVVSPFHLLECVKLLSERDQDLPMHLKFLVDNASHFYLCSKSFNAVVAATK